MLEPRVNFGPKAQGIMKFGRFKKDIVVTSGIFG